MSKDKIVQELQLDPECKTCGRYLTEPHDCKGRQNTPIRCMAYLEVKDE